MGLRFIYGAAGTGKSTYCLNGIKKRIDSGFNRELIIIVPEQFSFQAEKNLLKVVGERGIIKANVFSFKRLANRIFNEVGGITREHINSAGRSMLLYKVLEENKYKLKYFERAGRQQGFVDIMSDTITELKRYNVTPELMKSTIDKIDDEILMSKLQDINLIFERFEEVLHERYIDSEDDLTMLLDKMEGSHFFDGAEIWFDEFSTFTPQQYSIIGKLLKKANQVNVTLTLKRDDSGVFSTALNTENKLLRLAAENNVTYEKPVELQENYRFIHSPELAHLEKYFFSSHSAVYSDEVKEVSLYKALNLYSEVQNTARDIIKLCREKNLRFNDIAVIVRELDGYSELIQVIFREYGIPFFIDEKREIDRNPLIIFINSLMKIYSKNWSYESVFAYLKTGFPGIPKEDIDILENYVLANGIKGKQWHEENWSYRLNYDFESEEISEKEKALISHINEIKLKVTAPLIKFGETLKESKKMRDVCAALYDFFVELGVPDRLQQWIDDFNNSGDLELSSEYAQVWNTIMELLNQVVNVLGDEKFKTDEFIKILSVGIAEFQIGLIPTSIDQVLVGSMERVKSHPICAVYILGANDGVFPKVSMEEGILNDRDRNVLREAGLEIAQDTRSQAVEEQYIIYSTLTIAGKYLRISYPIGDFEGRALRPSIIVSKLKRVFRKIVENSEINIQQSRRESLERISTPEATFNEMIFNIRNNHEGLEIDSLWYEVYHWYNKQELWRERVKRTFAGAYYSNQVEQVDSQKIRKIYGEPLQFSVSRVEKYVECPFAYYVQYGLKAKERKVYEVSAPDLGTFMHSVLDEFSLALEKEGLQWREIDREWCNEAVSIIVEQEIRKKNGYILDSSPRYKFMVERLKNILSRSVFTISEHIKRGTFNPKGYEVEFGKNGQFPPITMELSDGEIITFTGRIDRVDELETEEGTYIRIVDYKSGNKDFKLSDIYYGLQLQLLVYLDAILSNWNSYRSGESIPGAVLYFRLDNPIIGTNGELSEDEIEKEILKRLKMQGLVLNDAHIVKDMDYNISGYSLIIPAQMNKDGSLGGGTSGATKEQFDILRSYVRKTVVDICEEMLQGNISILPCKKSNFIACQFCKFSSICSFDLRLRNNKYNIFNEKSKEEVWELMEEIVEGKAGDKHGRN